MIELSEYKKALGALVDELSEEEILKLRDNQDQIADIFFDLWLEHSKQVNNIML